MFICMAGNGHVSKLGEKARRVVTLYRVKTYPTHPDTQRSGAPTVGWEIVREQLRCSEHLQVSPKEVRT